MTSLGRVVLGAVLAVAVAYALYTLRHALLMIYVAVVLAILFDPFVELVRRVRIRRYRPSRGAATAVVALATAAVLVLIGIVIVPPVITDASRLEKDWPQQSARLFDRLHRTVPFTRSIDASIVARWVSGVVGHSPMLTVGATAMDVLVTLLLAIYMLADGPVAFDWAVSLVPEARRPKLAAALRAAARRMQGWVGGQGILMLTHGGSALVTFWLLGLPYALPLALFAGLINVIPVLGPVLTLVAAGLVAAINSPGKVLGVAVFYLAYHNAEGLYLQPKVMSSAVGIPGVAVVAALIIGDEVAGFVGMALSVPTAVLVGELKARYLGR